jgi:putative ABC transport system substrate-binding protein
MRRREFITLFAGAAAWVSLARAQEPRRVIGFVGSASFAAERWRLAAFVQALKDTGFIEGNNISIESRYAEGQYKRLPSLAGELVSRGVAVIVAVDAPAASAAKAATKTIPIVFVTGADPVTTGLVDSFNRPGGNLTGVFILLSMLGSKVWSFCVSCSLLPARSRCLLTQAIRTSLMHPTQKRRPTLSGDAWRC